MSSYDARAFEGAALVTEETAERDREVAALFNLHYTPLCRLAYVILGDQGQAEEIVMDCLLKTLSGWGRIRDVERVDAYLRRAVVNQCRSRIRRKAVESRAGSILRRRAEMSVPDWDPERRETGRLVWDAVKELPERQRACVVLRYLEDLPEAEIAEALECSVGTVKSQLSKARTKLERSLSASLVGGGS